VYLQDSDIMAIDRKNSEGDVALATGSLYASIWDEFEKEEWERFADGLFRRWSPLPVDEGFFDGKRCLDAGCGSGRAVRSILQSGAARVCAIDAGEGCIRNTVERNREYADRLETTVASVLHIPYPTGCFDVAHCDGVLHHTTRPRTGFSELVRVLKPGGTLIVGVLGRGGFLNAAISFARVFRHLIPKPFTARLCRWLIRDRMLWYAVIDAMYVPVRHTYSKAAILQWFSDAGMTNVVRVPMKWGPYALGRWMSGEGYLKYMATKPKSARTEGTL